MKKNNIIEWAFPTFVSFCCVLALIGMFITEKTTGVMATAICCFVVWIPYVVSSLTRMKLPTVLQFLAVFQMFLGVFIGSGLGIYYRIYFWDTILHTWSGVLFCFVGFWLIARSKDKMRTLNIVMYAVGFSFMISVLWEIWEYGADFFVNGSNMQKFALEDGTPLIGREALKDTMGDFICHTVGCSLFILFYIIDFKMRQGRLFKSIYEDFANANEKEVV